MDNDRVRMVEKLTREFLAKVGEYADTTQVFCTLHNGETTSTYDLGQGNIYARQGQVDEWLVIQHQYQRNYALRKDEED